MKSKTEDQKIKLNGLTFVLLLTLVHFPVAISAQGNVSTESILGSDTKVSELLVPEIKINSIQGDIGTLIGFYCGPVINKRFLIGACGGVNLGHPKVNYGYFGGIGQYIFIPEKIVHFSSQLVIAFGTTKDYESPKSGPLDNFWNISGASFFMMEPGFNLELNISDKLTLATGVSYRFISGLDENSDDISRTHVTNEALSGVNYNIGLKFSKDKKSK